MIAHFLKRDFSDFRVAWIILCVATLLWLWGHYTWNIKIDIFFVGMGYFIFSQLPTQHILGSLWRTQHAMSRHYLLSLPISHKLLFVIQQVRLAIFLLPLFLLACFFPFLFVERKSSFTGEFLFFYYLGLFVSAGLWLQLDIWQSLEWERISSYLPKGERLWAYIRWFVIFVGTFYLIFFSFWELFFEQLEVRHFFFMKGVSYRFLFPIGFVALIFWIPHNARRWCVTL